MHRKWIDMKLSSIFSIKSTMSYLFWDVNGRIIKHVRIERNKLDENDSFEMKRRRKIIVVGCFAAVFSIIINVYHFSTYSSGFCFENKTPKTIVLSVRTKTLYIVWIRIILFLFIFFFMSVDFHKGAGKFQCDFIIISIWQWFWFWFCFPWPFAFVSSHIISSL